MPRRPRPRDWLATRLRATADAVAPAPAGLPAGPATPSTDPAVRWAGPAPASRGPGQPPEHWLRTVAAHAPGLLHDLVGPAAADPPGPPPTADASPAPHPGVRGRSTPASARPPAYPPRTGAPTADRHAAHPPVEVPPPTPTPPTGPWGSSPVPGPVTGTHLPRPAGPAAVTPIAASAGHRAHPTSAYDPDPATAYPPSARGPDPASAHRPHPPSAHGPDQSTTPGPDPATADRPGPGARPTAVAARPGPGWTAGAGLGWLLRPGRRRSTPPRPPTTDTDPDRRAWAGHKPPPDAGLAPGTHAAAGARYPASDTPPPAPGRPGLAPPARPDHHAPGRPVRPEGPTDAGASAGRRPADGRRTGGAVSDAASAAGTDAASGGPVGWGPTASGRAGDPVTGPGTGDDPHDPVGGGRRGGGTHPVPDGCAPGHGTVGRRITATRWPDDDPIPAGDPWPTLPDGPAGPTGAGDAPATPGSGPVGADPWPALPDDGACRLPTGTARDDARHARLDAEQRGY
ncbi:hypothetical protein [Micromonospora wenchangensis]|uniref:hypothetical protein n=1 Tax=Micromonospora wenchangensis TaxID=1185415 RepID=UPI003D7452DF